MTAPGPNGVPTPPPRRRPADARPRPPAAKLRLATQLSHLGRAGTRINGFVNPPVQRGSTMLYPTPPSRRPAAARRLGRGFLYGTAGNPTHHALEDMVAAVEGGTHCQIVSTGLAAVTVPLLAYLSAGDHLLLPDSVYGPARNFADNYLTRMNIASPTTTRRSTPPGLAALIRPDTRVLYTESPGSHTFEVQDIPALAAVAHDRGLTVMMDNTWGIRSFQPFDARRGRVDPGADQIRRRPFGRAARQHHRRRRGRIGSGCAAPPSCSANMPARTIAGSPCAAPAPWACGWTGRCSPAWRSRSGSPTAPRSPACCTRRCPAPPATTCGSGTSPAPPACSASSSSRSSRTAAVDAFIDSLTLFGIGASWGGFESLALPTTGHITRTAGSGKFAGPVARFHIGLEDPADLIADIERAMGALHAS